MLFNSFSFLEFFPVVTLLFFVLRGQSRLVLLLLASIYFYAVFIPKFIVILFFLIGVDFVAGLLIEPAQGKKRKWFLISSLIANIGILGVFKYFDFFNANLGTFLKIFHISYQPQALSLILPIGLSFHTFQSMSYTIEVYKGKQKAERNLLVYAVYVLFYPQLVAGPIERPQNLLHQFYELKNFNFENFMMGLELMLFGFLKKIFVADRLAVYANEVFNSPGVAQNSRLSTLLGVYFFSFQIYCDFSGYTDIARGAAQVMGFSLMKNFDNPYSASSVPEFWHRWHISLSTWFRDYVYFPLGGNRTSKAFWVMNILIVFLLSGLWHGANWTFIVWGALHGLYVISTRFGTRLIPALSKTPLFLKRFFTFNLVALAWIFFRAKDLKIAGQIFSNLMRDPWNLSEFLKGIMTHDSVRLGIGALIIFAIVAKVRKKILFGTSEKFPSFFLKLWRPTLWFAVLIQLIILGAPLNETAFIYFQF